MASQNEFGQQVGDPLEGWQPPNFPSHVELFGRTVTVAPFRAAEHGHQLFDALGTAPDSLWTYMSLGPFRNRQSLADTLTDLGNKDDWLMYAVSVDDVALGFMAYLRIDAHAGAIEIGSIVFSPLMQRTTASTEAVYLMLKNAFGLGYRRCEWKCDALNAQSRSSAMRLGFEYEGTFRQATHYKGRNRDTAWYAITDNDWPQIERGFSVWLSEDNFDEGGMQLSGLVELRNAGRQ